MGLAIRRVFWFMSMFFLALVMVLTIRQVFSLALANHPGNRRQLLSEYLNERGAILAADNQVLAESVPVGKKFKRYYPKAEEMAAITGYWDPVHGRSGIEQSYNYLLSGNNPSNDFLSWLLNSDLRRKHGYDIVLTIDSRLQQVAWRAMSDEKGAAVVISPKTGAILALVSKPSYDPNKVIDKWKRIAKSKEGLLLNRALQGRYPPGSIFKIVTAAAALESGKVELSSKYQAPAELRVEHSSVKNFGGESYTSLSFADAFIHSVNTVFAQIGLKIGGSRLKEKIMDFGFNQPIKFDLPIKSSSLPDPESMEDILLAWTAVGQGETLITPLQAALLAAAVANDGKIFQPYLVKLVRHYNGRVVKEFKPRLWKKAMQPEVAGKLKELMIKTVDQGTGRRAGISGLKVAGKTGTAEVKKGQPHSWFVAFAPADDPNIAVAVVVEHGGLGGRVAASIAKDIIKQSLK
jgi:peptidoglycan glycosyltransferase